MVAEIVTETKEEPVIVTFAKLPDKVKSVKSELAATTLKLLDIAAATASSL